MQDQVGNLYAHFINFSIRSIKWYQEPRLKHAITSITKPYSLRFKDIVEDIQHTTRQIDRLALSMSQAEQRQILLKLEETRKELAAAQVAHSETSRLMLAEIKKVIDGKLLEQKFRLGGPETLTSRNDLGAQLQFSGLINTNQRLNDIQISQIMTFLSTSSLPDPDAVRNTLSAKRKLRLRLGQGPNLLPDYHAALLQEWGASQTSCQILVDGPFAKRHTLRDFAIDLIDLVSSANIPTVWALDTNACSPDTSMPADIIKCLAAQVLKCNSHAMADERSAVLSARQFQSARTEKEWFALLGEVLGGLQQVYLIIDLNLVEKLGEGAGDMEVSWLGKFPHLFNKFKERNVQTVIKVAFVRTARLEEEVETLNLPNATPRIQIPRKLPGKVTKKAASTKKRRWRGRGGMLKGSLTSPSN